MARGVIIFVYDQGEGTLDTLARLVVLLGPLPVVDKLEHDLLEIFKDALVGALYLLCIDFHSSIEFLSAGGDGAKAENEQTEYYKYFVHRKSMMSWAASALDLRGKGYSSVEVTSVTLLVS